MDAYNHFESDITFKLTRLENLVALFVSLALFIAHIGEVRWLPAVLLFVYIDVIGYIPGLIAERRSLASGGDGRISKVYYVLYNVMHTWITQAVVIGLWGWIFGFEWALLVIPIHLCGDRSVFGNSLKPFSIPFDSKGPIPEFADFRGRLAGGVLTGPRAERTAR
ncbi:hypothetical protein [Nocardia terpenica]|uniref:DUF4260 family protein n=1 Tax=Nocardia terpenica TaxID=455432 RepID=A0A161WQS8_9NOCA|nr:hypothetical protein [Nocardia terpenica]KZM75685.1 hypothetical protein AWN90_20265 [Nocardia terpenica]NQE86188.1 hypothetical protein [Nocardia terpenica]